MLTRLEWFNTIDDEDIRHRAIGNTQDQAEWRGYATDLLTDKCENLNEALTSGFIWGQTPEGTNFWANQCLALTGII
jgi:hypothetical protein